LKGLRQFLDDEQQRAWLDGDAELTDATERDESLELRFKYLPRFEKFMRRPQAEDTLDILKAYADACIPIPRTTERWYWSVSCLPSTDKTLARVNASWMEFFALQPDGDGLRARVILHLADFTHDGSTDPDALDQDLLDSCAGRPADVSHAIWRNGKGILIAKVRGGDAIRHFIAHPHSLRAIRTFNLTYMNRGRNTYQGSHCYSIADHMLGDA